MLSLSHTYIYISTSLWVNLFTDTSIFIGIDIVDRKKLLLFFSQSSCYSWYLIFKILILIVSSFKDNVVFVHWDPEHLLTFIYCNTSPLIRQLPVDWQLRVKPSHTRTPCITRVDFLALNLPLQGFVVCFRRHWPFLIICNIFLLSVSIFWLQ